MRRLSEVLELTESGKLSQDTTRKLLRTNAVQSAYTNDVLMNHILTRTGVEKRFVGICSSGHAAVSIRSDTNGEECPSQDCKLSVSQKFWYSLLSKQLAAMCREKASFDQFRDGCTSAEASLQSPCDDYLYDYYDGSLFRRLHCSKMAAWKEDDEIVIFLTMSSDGFGICKERGTQKTSWPVVFVILNQDHEMRFKASNCLVTAFIPGTHDSDSFDSFLEPIIEDLKKLERGMRIVCYDGKERLLRAFVIFFSSDWPAGSNVLGFVGHNGTCFCRQCRKEVKK